MDLKLSGKVAMVGGASRGLGLAVARALAADGAQVSIASRSREAIEAAGRQIAETTGASVVSTAADLASPEAITRWHQATMDRFGGFAERIRAISITAAVPDALSSAPFRIALPASGSCA